MDIRSLRLKSEYSHTWSNLLCETCLRNAHKQERLELRTVISPTDDKRRAQLYVCTRCGSTRSL